MYKLILNTLLKAELTNITANIHKPLWAKDKLTSLTNPKKHKKPKKP